MPVKESGKIWMNGDFVEWKDAKIHVLSHVVHYGSSWFEGIRCYNTEKGPAIFRLGKHLERLYDSAKIYYAEIPYSKEDLEKAVIDTVHVNEMKSCYIRPIAYRGYSEISINPLNHPVDVAIAVWDFKSSLGADSIENGIDVCVSSWSRPAPNTLPALAKTGANYASSQLIKAEAVKLGFPEGIALDVSGYVSEGSGENLFVVKNGIVYTPTSASSILCGVTRDSVMILLEESGYKVKEATIPRELLSIADEIFFSGTAAEITPVRSVARIRVGSGKPGPVTRWLQERFFDIVRKGNNHNEWLKYI